jgi:parallel beta-helix repeat protein
MNGAGIGAVLGHTIYGGVLAENSFLRASEAGKPLYSGLVVQNNQFRNLKGRGVAVYATDAVLISGNRFERGRAECVEVDHHTSAEVLENQFLRCGVAIQLDDAFKTIVSRNVIKNSRRGIVLLGHFDDSWVNTGNIISENELSGCAPIGIMVGAQVSGNTVSGNQMRDCPKQIVDEAPGRNQILEPVPQEN